MTTLEIRVLGPPTLHLNGQVCTVRSHKALALLCVLAMLREQSVESLRAWDKAIGAAQAVNTPGLIPVVQALKTLVLMERGVHEGNDKNVRDSEALCAATLPVTEASGEQFAYTLLVTLQGRLAAWRGDVQAGLRRGWQGVKQAFDTQNGMVVQLALPLLMALLAEAGRTEDAGLLIGYALHGLDTTAWLRTRAWRTQETLSDGESGDGRVYPPGEPPIITQVLRVLQSRPWAEDRP
ncbi:hypothetical protein [Deinococcus ficus]|uniref:Uncharacterized protein n=1 Tax=Deinococcus ficus TaxID=317577 RepID=A0A221T101_9DEIO|nr:hypothetical protein [Deinococcus ficus]ASN82578.1 hypothetical protein DFI_15495 [Deinococcus ficus]